MLERIVCYYTYRCDRCGRRESVTARLVEREGKTCRYNPGPPADWKQTMGAQFCPECIRVIEIVAFGEKKS
jgi:hypothetical protein